ncbi:hypothetical protein H8958_022353 [Nasalis larvatus]
MAFWLFIFLDGCLSQYCLLRFRQPCGAYSSGDEGKCVPGEVTESGAAFRELQMVQASLPPQGSRKHHHNQAARSQGFQRPSCALVGVRNLVKVFWSRPWISTQYLLSILTIYDNFNPHLIIFYAMFTASSPGVDSISKHFLCSSKETTLYLLKFYKEFQQFSHILKLQF